ncbi:lytic transglycosylase domain-containing protein [Campylobacter fetus]|uniref:LysM domain-containing protein n=1 Tax=Campylobacter fetus subsp. testudinum TaxID=1507806 RepID=A0AAX0HDI5_CAMFE|nr:lytic transglycosylase domain-containing protein [Campylobacter fetus]ALV65194.1 membrane-bound lytic murein transglycosylase D [Campylobacter fetus subsp. testudinum Sp3]AVK81460.1 lytic transglycosylase [Campylobacter fetus subsp. testudinum]EAK0826451.1 LysM peptidoglycan-binding domain-containing protein [Campylobacter fetus]EAK0829695.1 LysM peptidoglycan-binding domain-containing protein [Campylobacter fetus]MPB72496.1 LysM peptidoglycan-binding domain-containing protein [Campylobacte
MRFFIAILLCFLTYSSAFGFIQTRDDYSAQLRILKELDIDPKYMKDPYFLAMKAEGSNIAKKDFVNTIKEEYKHISMLKELISKTDMPNSFLYLAMVESGLSNKAVSNVKAVGMWQFMEGTAKLYGLRVDKYVDERRDPVASTLAAVQYLKRLKEQFGKWYLAIMAYNSGEVRVKQAIQKAGTDELSVLIDPDKKYLSLETRLFIRKILIAANMAEDSDFIISNDSSMLNRPNQISVSKVFVPGGTSLAMVASSIGLSLKKLKEHNAHLRYDFTPPNQKEYHIYIPIGKKDLFATNFKSFNNDQKFQIYSVKKGDTIAKIASKWRVSAKDIQKYNEIAKLSPNSQIIIPVSKNTAPIFENYKVKKGDTLAGISKKFDVEVKEIIKANNIKNSKVAAGDSLVIPK